MHVKTKLMSALLVLVMLFTFVPTVGIQWNLNADAAEADTNVAVGKEVTAKSSSSGHGPELAVDGNAATGWSTDESAVGTWLYVNLAEPMDISSVSIKFLESKLVDYTIEVSLDAIHWYKAATVAGNTNSSSTQKVEFRSTYMQYVRITIDQLESGAKLGINEFEVMGHASATLQEVPQGQLILDDKTGKYYRPVTPPVADSVDGTDECKIDLNGTWKFKMEPEQSFWTHDIDDTWSDIPVPAEPNMVGFPIHVVEGGSYGCPPHNARPVENIEYPYKKQITIPQDFAGKKIMIRFESVFDYARVWVDGQLVREHRGGYVTFDADITNYVTPGQTHTITVGVTAETNSLAFPHARGILGNISLLAMPKDHISSFHFTTDLDDKYVDATLNIESEVTFNTASDAKINYKLTDPDGKTVAITPASETFTPGENLKTTAIPVKNPVKWDAEHPNLYTLQADLVVGGKTVESVTKRVGFREITIKDNVAYVNGDIVKLRGANWSQGSALIGYAADPVFDHESLVQLKEANVNYIRTSHFPQYEYFLDWCDEMGFYVEQEFSVFFIEGQGHAMGTKDDPYYAPYYVAAGAESIEVCKSHPSIFFYSIGNESTWGSNLTVLHDYSRAADPTRGTKFSYPARPNPCEISSWHYVPLGSINDPYLQDWAENKPCVFDEYVHVPNRGVDNGTTHRTDPGDNEYYSQGIKAYWDAILKTPTALGGAIWKANDDAYYNPDAQYKGLDEWGFIDSWARPKNIHWYVKKAYSPTRIDEETFEIPTKGEPLTIEVMNAYNHTNLNEISIEWSVGEKSGKMTGPDLEPFKTGTFTIPYTDWAIGDEINVKFVEADGLMVDEYNIRIGKNNFSFIDKDSSKPSIAQTSKAITVKGSDFSISFDKASGQITEGKYKGETVITGGPRLNLMPYNPGVFTCNSISARMVDDNAVVTILGVYQNSAIIDAKMVLTIDGSGRIVTDYTINSITNPPAGYTETGIQFDMPNTVNKIEWKSKAFASAYPEHHLGRNEGTANKLRDTVLDKPDEKPTWDWNLDMTSHYYFEEDGIIRGTREFAASKYNFYYYSAYIGETDVRLMAEGNGSGSCRSYVNPSDLSIKFNINTDYGYTTWGNTVQKDIDVKVGKTYTVAMRMTDTNDFIEAYTRDKGISKLNLKGGKLDKVFKPDVTEYNLEVTSEDGIVEITPIINDPSAYIQLGDKYMKAGETAKLHVTSSTSTYELTAYSDEGATKVTYKFNIMKRKTGISGTRISASTPASDGSIAYMIDGSYSTPYSSQLGAALPQTITLTFPSAQKFDKLTLVCNLADKQGPTKVDIQVSENGTAYKTLQSNVTIPWKQVDSNIWTADLDFDMQNAKGIKLVVTAANLEWAHFTICELEVHDTTQKENVPVTAEFTEYHPDNLQRANAKTTIADYIKSQSATDGTVRVVDQNGKVVTSGYVATGMKKQVVNGNAVLHEWVLYVVGDVDGDGSVTALDMMAIKRNILGKDKLNAAQTKAANVNDTDEDINVLDMMGVKKIILGKN